MNTNSEFDFFQIGQKRDIWKTIDGAVLEYNESSGFILTVGYPNLKPIELEQMETDKPVSISFRGFENVSFFCIKFGAMGHIDCPFLPNLYEDQEMFLSPIQEGKGYAFNIFVVEPTRGELLYMRTLGLGEGISDAIYKWCHKVMERNITRDDYNATIEKVYKRYPTSKKLAKDCDVTWRLHL